MDKFGDLTSARGTEAQSPTLGADWDNDDDGFDNEAEETANSRFYGGIHYMTAIEEGSKQGKQVGEWIWKNISTRPDKVAGKK